MTKEEISILDKFGKERRDWWRTVYLESLSKFKEPKQPADKALRIFDKRFSQGTIKEEAK